MNRRQRTTLAALFFKPVASGIRWADIEQLVRSLGGTVEEREGSRVVFKLKGARAVFHRPHPRPEADRNSVKDVQRFLEKAGVQPEERGI